MNRIPEAILDSILPRFTELQIYQALLESVASEHSARMVAMRNATENARELIDGLSLVYNKARQWNITKEMLDIAGGAEALRQALCDCNNNVSRNRIKLNCLEERHGERCNRTGHSSYRSRRRR